MKGQETKQEATKKLEVCNFIKEETLVQVISWKLFKLFENNFLIEQLCGCFWMSKDKNDKSKLG